jgi:hypothetical protein
VESTSISFLRFVPLAQRHQVIVGIERVFQLLLGSSWPAEEPGHFSCAFRLAQGVVDRFLARLQSSQFHNAKQLLLIQFHRSFHPYNNMGALPVLQCIIFEVMKPHRAEPQLNRLGLDLTFS